MTPEAPGAACGAQNDKLSDGPYTLIIRGLRTDGGEPILWL
jgi:hypothetical protein